LEYLSLSLVIYEFHSRKDNLLGEPILDRGVENFEPGV
jgi:hypothetical protein